MTSQLELPKQPALPFDVETLDLVERLELGLGQGPTGVGDHDVALVLRAGCDVGEEELSSLGHADRIYVQAVNLVTFSTIARPRA